MSRAPGRRRPLARPRSLVSAGMWVRRPSLLVGTSVLALAACSGGSTATPDLAVDDTSPDSASDTTTTTQAPATTSTTTSTTATTQPGPDPTCVVEVESGDSLGAIVERVNDDAVTLAGLQDENRIFDGDVIHPGDQIDVCVGNDLDDVTGASRLPPGPEAVMAQQRKLNELFEPYAIAELLVDGISGPLTRQMLCAARLGLGMRTNTTDMPDGSQEEETLFAADTISIPAGAATWATRWILIDETCQVVFTGEGADRLVDVFPTSTGEPGYPTHNLQGAAAYRFDPAVDNDGWHDSTNFPSAVDNPLNGNMYKPLYFNGGQALHGANVVPPDPRSKGCARLFPWHHDSMLAWLGLDDLTTVSWRAGALDVIVTVQGDYRPAEDGE